MAGRDKVRDAGPADCFEFRLSSQRDAEFELFYGPVNDNTTKTL